MALSQREVFLTAEVAKTLSQLLELENFKPDALRWLDRSQVDKFLNAIDESESAKVRRLAASWRSSNGRESVGFPVLNWLWVTGVDPGSSSSLSPSSESGPGRGVIACLARFEPDWVARWWQWRCANKRGMWPHLKLMEGAVIDALSREDLVGCLSLLEDESVAAIIASRPEFIDLLPEERRGLVLRSALDENSQFTGVVEALSRHDIPSDSSAVISAIFAGVVAFDKQEKESKLFTRLEELVTKWKGRPRSNPVASAMIAGHELLEALLRSPWSQDLGIHSNDKTMWSDPLSSLSLRRVFLAAAVVVPEQFRLELGFSIGVRLAERELEPSQEQIVKEVRTLDLDSAEGIVDVLTPMITLWATLRTIARYESSRGHETELVGLRATLSSLVEGAPSLWVESLPWILGRSSKLGDGAEAVTLELASNHPEVHSALRCACRAKTEHVRLMASGLLALLHEIEDPRSGSARTLADAAARHMDGVPIFPHPLGVMSATWLGSIGVEQAITNAVRRATTRFAGDVRHQGGNIEEALTNSLIKEIEVEFREVQLRLKALASSRERLPAPILSVRQRPTSKSVEEPVYGCDLAWLLQATVRGFYLATWVDLVQVKKSKALHRDRNNKSKDNAWKIEVKQLKDILKWSATAVYWLIASDGEVLVIPAKHLLGIKRGSGKTATAKSFTVGYNVIRSAAIPLEQYLVDLLIGQWVGTTSEEVVRFVEGDSNIRPMSVVEITITIGQENQ